MPIPKQSKAIHQLSAKERVYNTLKDWIIDGTLEPGEKISDVEIANYFSVSRTPVREAIQQLAAQKLVDVFPGKESLVTTVDLDTMRETYVMLAELQGLAVQFAFNKITDEVIDQLESINKQIIKSWRSKDLHAVQLHDSEFHDVFLKLASNDFLTGFCNTLYIHALRTENMYYALSDSRKNTSDEHEQIIQALKDKDLDQAIKAMKYNWTHTIDLLEETVRKQDS